MHANSNSGGDPAIEDFSPRWEILRFDQGSAAVFAGHGVIDARSSVERASLAPAGLRGAADARPSPPALVSVGIYSSERRAE